MAFAYRPPHAPLDTYTPTSLADVPFVKPQGIRGADLSGLEDVFTPPAAGGLGSAGGVYGSPSGSFQYGGQTLEPEVFTAPRPAFAAPVAVTPPVLGDPDHPLTAPPSRRGSGPFIGPPEPEADDYVPTGGGGTGMLRIPGSPTGNEPEPVFDPTTGQNMPGIAVSPASFYNRTAGDVTAIENLRRRGDEQRAGLLRPLLAVRGDNGGPLSAADMVNNQNAMQALDDYYTTGPQAQRIQEATGAAAEAKANLLAQDPYAEQSARINDQMALKEYESGLQSQQEAGRREALGAEMEELMAETQAALARAATPEQAEAIKERHEGQVQALREKHGIGARLNASGLYKSSGY